MPDFRGDSGEDRARNRDDNSPGSGGDPVPGVPQGPVQAPTQAPVQEPLVNPNAASKPNPGEVGTGTQSPKKSGQSPVPKAKNPAADQQDRESRADRAAQKARRLGKSAPKGNVQTPAVNPNSAASRLKEGALNLGGRSGRDTFSRPGGRGFQAFSGQAFNPFLLRSESAGFGRARQIAARDALNARNPIQTKGTGAGAGSALSQFKSNSRFGDELFR